MSKMVRINDNIDNQLKSLVKLTKESRQKIMEEAFDAYLRELILKKSNEQYAELKKDKKAWKEYKKEIEEWDATLLDGLQEYKNDKF